VPEKYAQVQQSFFRRTISSRDMQAQPPQEKNLPTTNEPGRWKNALDLSILYLV
jgi:hypothetical protein